MKAERKQADFMPIIITLETSDEADCLYHFLNAPDKSIEQLLEGEGCKRLLSVTYPMFDALDEVYTPEDADDC